MNKVHVLIDVSKTASTTTVLLVALLATWTVASAGQTDARRAGPVDRALDRAAAYQMLAAKEAETLQMKGR